MTGKETTKNGDRTMEPFFVQAEIWNMNEGIITALKIKDKLFLVGEYSIFKQPDPEIQKSKTRNVKISYLQKWIQSNEFVVFTLEQFFKAYPKQRDNTKLAINISNLIDKKLILQLSKNKFKVKRS